MTSDSERFMYWSTDTRLPLYVSPFFSSTSCASEAEDGGGEGEQREEGRECRGRRRVTMKVRRKQERTIGWFSAPFSTASGNILWRSTTAQRRREWKQERNRRARAQCSARRAGAARAARLRDAGKSDADKRKAYAGLLDVAKRINELAA